MNNDNFSVLITVYHKEVPNNFNIAMKSIWSDQILKPNEIVLVLDGMLSLELNSIVEKWKKKIKDILKVIQIENNIGLAGALNIGLSHCTYDIVARMDSDDISLPIRFIKQRNFLNKNPSISVVGSWISEFIEFPDKIVSFRNPPSNYSEIRKYIKYRNPINHPTVMYRKKAVIDCGGYDINLRNMQDYDLWIRLIANKYCLHNIPESLLLFRFNIDALNRRRGIDYLKYELQIQNRMKKLGLINHFEYFLNLIIKLPMRIMPKFLLKFIYLKLLRTNK